ncbi:MAG TPA: transcription-repair coupling factor [Candidatus Peribacteraceae bacterium]|nr:transcription-repair coupling factor [Candidatus Peribacteraceae bacterium]
MKPSLLIGGDTHRELSDLLRAEGDLVISGASNETAKAMILSHLLHFHTYPTLVVTEDEGQVDIIRHWLQFFEQDAVAFVDVHAGEGDEILTTETLQKFLLFMQGEKRVFVTSKDVFEKEFPVYSDLAMRALSLEKGQELPFTQFVEDLLERGYEHALDSILAPGQYRRTGDTLDIFPIQSNSPYRIDFHFDAIEKITRIEGDIHRTEEKVVLLPVSFEKTATIGRQLPDDGLLVIDDQDEIAAPKSGRHIRFTSFPESQEHHVHLRYLSVLKFYTLTDFLNDLKDKLQQDWSILIVTRRSDELQSIFKEERINFSMKERLPGAVTLVPTEDGELLPHSIQNPDLHSALLTDREIFSLRKAGKQRSVQKLALDFLTSLSPGDYVVHMEHGIGRFEGMTQKTIDDTVREYLELTYAENDKLFIPVDQADKLSKFVHEEGQEPVLTRLGQQEWKKVTERIKKETKEIAKDLLLLYAKRAAAKGFKYGNDNDTYRKFEEAFQYTETPGQMKAIEDIKHDMENEHPMDRLVCGDVGFGKTEVAMRAAFKAVQDGKQVAVIAPITILADQHYQNFKERMKGFNVKIDMLSRFRTAKQQEETIEKLRKGDVDIVIGTHRLLQDDVKFLNLGLVIIDEEQRFGVKQKEKFKDMRASVDILTLTATPIPRTLNLGLHKLRDITTITTPPPGRLPIITEVRKYSDQLVRQAILHEIERGGQCFVLHNRVETIDAFADKLRKLVPEASFVVAHGQLKADDLEERILSFKQGKHLVLVSSTIIENGIDLPRANTLIVNEAEHFGLAQLYQLRGRVGRSKVQAYAYLLYHTQKLKDDAKKRLRAIVEACELGSGFQVAMRDLEIRGAGEILGVSQAGTMNTVGISHYLRMLKNAVEELKAGGRAVEEEIENVEILVPIEALLPTFYIPDSGEKISVYQKLASSEDEATLLEFESDLRDEYGEPPKQVQNLFAVLKLKLICRKAGVIRVKSEDRGKTAKDIVLSLSPRVEAMDIMRILQVNPQWKISSNTIRIGEEELIKRATSGDWLSELTDEIKLLIRPPKAKKEKAKVEVGE